MKSTNIFKIILVLIILGLAYLKWQASSEIPTYIPSPTPAVLASPSPEASPDTGLQPEPIPTRSPAQPLP